MTFDDIDKLDKCYYISNKINPKSWYLSDKMNSEVVYNLLINIDRLNKINININDAINFICILFQMTHDSNYHPVPDIIATRYIQKSRRKIRDLLYLLGNTDILDIKWIYGQLHYKLNKKLLLTDELIHLKCDKNYIRFDNLRREAAAKNNSFYFEPFTNQTIHTWQREVIIGISLAYTKELQRKIPRNVLANPTSLQREDITYIEVPYKILCPLLNMSETRLKNKLMMLCKQTSYIKKHNKVYIDDINNGKIINHYKNYEYNKCPLIEYTEAPNEIGKPNITEWSFILFNNEIDKSNIHNRLIRNAQYYKDIVRYELNNIIENNKTIYDCAYTECEESNINYLMNGDDIKSKFDMEDRNNDLLYSYSDSINHIDKSKLYQKTTDNYKKHRILSFKNINTMSITALNKLYDKIVNQFILYDCVSSKNITSYIEALKKIEFRRQCLSV